MRRRFHCFNHFLLLGSLLLMSASAWAQSTLINGSRVITGSINYCAEVSDDDTNVNTYRCPLAPAIPSYRTGTRYSFKAFTTNTGAASLNLNSLGAKTIKKMAGAITTDLVANDIRAGQIIDVFYDGTNMQMVSQLGNAATGTGDFSTTGVSVSVDSEVVLFSGTGGKTGKRATGTGLATLASGVLGTTAAPSGAVTGTIASGATTLGTGALASAKCTGDAGEPSLVTATATGAVSTDTVVANFNGNVTAVTGYTPATTGTLRIDVYPSTNLVSFKVCNATAASVTPGAVTLNWRVVR
jgi:hypothetical protein